MRNTLAILLAVLCVACSAAPALAMYEPTLGRFIQRDPGGAWHDRLAHGNAYTYAASNPGKYVDRNGWAAHEPSVIPDEEWGNPGWIPLPPDVHGPPVPTKPRPSRGNCYRLACDDPIRNPREPHSPFPGGKDPGGVVSCDQIKKGALKDGMKETNDCGECPAGTTKVGYGITPPLGPNKDWNDYHWWRRAPDGRWRHKPGETPVRDWDEDGKPITDPKDANRGPYTTFCGYLCAPGGMDLDK